MENINKIILATLDPEQYNGASVGDSLNGRFVEKVFCLVIYFNLCVYNGLHPLENTVWNYLSIPKLQRLHRWCYEMDKSFHPTLYWSCDNLSMLGFKLIHVTKGVPGHNVFTVRGTTFSAFI